MSYRFQRRRPHAAQVVAPSASGAMHEKQYAGSGFLHLAHLRARSSGFAAWQCGQMRSVTSADDSALPRTAHGSRGPRARPPAPRAARHTSPSHFAITAAKAMTTAGTLDEANCEGVYRFGRTDTNAPMTERSARIGPRTSKARVRSSVRSKIRAARMGSGAHLAYAGLG